MTERTSKKQISLTWLLQLLTVLRNQVLFMAIQTVILRFCLNLVVVPRFNIPEFTFGEVFVSVLAFAVLTYRTYATLYSHASNSVILADHIINSQRQIAVFIGAKLADITALLANIHPSDNSGAGQDKNKLD